MPLSREMEFTDLTEEEFHLQERLADLFGEVSDIALDFCHKNPKGASLAALRKAVKLLANQETPEDVRHWALEIAAIAMFIADQGKFQKR